MSACDSLGTEESCRADSSCLVWRLDGKQEFSKCMNATDCDETRGMQNFNGECSCENAGYNI